MVDMGEKTAPSAAERTMAFFWGTVKIEYATSEAAGCSLMGSAVASISGACSGPGVWWFDVV